MLNESIDRRGFVKGAAASGALAIGLSVSSQAIANESSSAESEEASEAIKYAEYDANMTPVVEEFVKPAVNIGDVAADDTVECEYLVIGAGNTGLLSAARAAELGVKVVLLEATEYVGGSSSGTEAHFGLDTIAYVKEQGMKTWTIPEAADYFNLYNEYHSSQSLLMSFLTHLNEPFDWWIDKGATVNSLLDGLAGVGTSAGMFFEGKAAALAEIDKQVIDEFGVDVRTSAVATNLVVDDSGAVVGALADTPDGVLFVNSQYTLVCTGGFGNNPEMVNAYMGARGNAMIVSDAVMHHNGDGLNMMLGAGGITGILETASVTGIQAENADYVGDITRAASEPYLWINKYGQRVGCEYWTNPTYAWSLIAWSPEYCAYTVFDQGLVERMQTEDFFCQSKDLPYTYDPVPDMGEQIEQAVADGIVIKSDTLEGLAEAAGIAVDPFLATVEQYNAACEAGFDDVFYKDPSMMIAIQKPPFYAIKLVCARLSSLNGCMINADCQVYDKDGNWIHGLFAGGPDSAGFFIGDYNHAFSGSCSTYSYFTGWRSATVVAQLLGKTE